MSASLHPSDDLLLAYGAGTLDEATALLVATHMTLCPRCRGVVGQVESAGGALLEALAPDLLKADALECILARLDDPAPSPLPVRPAAVSGDFVLPRPLRDYIGGDIDRVRWKRMGSLEQSLVVASGDTRARLYRLSPGMKVPEHGHGGDEITLVLQGGFRDLNGHYGPGDVAVADESVVHMPVSDPDQPCVCLAVTGAPLRLSGWMGRLLSPFLNL